MNITKLQLLRESKNLSIEALASKALHYRDCGNLGHMVLIIRSIEEGRPFTPRPRKTYEWAALSKALHCKIEDIQEDKQR